MLVHLRLSQANSPAKFVFTARVILSRGQSGAKGSKGQAAELQLLEKGVMAAVLLNPEMLLLSGQGGWERSQQKCKGESFTWAFKMKSIKIRITYTLFCKKSRSSLAGIKISLQPAFFFSFNIYPVNPSSPSAFDFLSGSKHQTGLETISRGLVAFWKCNWPTLSPCNVPAGALLCLQPCKSLPATRTTHT